MGRMRFWDAKSLNLRDSSFGMDNACDGFRRHNRSESGVGDANAPRLWISQQNLRSPLRRRRKTVHLLPSRTLEIAKLATPDLRHDRNRLVVA